MFGLFKKKDGFFLELDENNQAQVEATATATVPKPVEEPKAEPAPVEAVEEPKAEPAPVEAVEEPKAEAAPVETVIKKKTKPAKEKSGRAKKLEALKAQVQKQEKVEEAPQPEPVPATSIPVVSANVPVKAVKKLQPPERYMPSYLMPTVTPRRRPGANMAKFKSLARQVKKPRV